MAIRRAEIEAEIRNAQRGIETLWEAPAIISRIAAIAVRAVNEDPALDLAALAWGDHVLLSFARGCVRSNRGVAPELWKPVARYILFLRALLVVEAKRIRAEKWPDPVMRRGDWWVNPAGEIRRCTLADDQTVTVCDAHGRNHETFTQGDPTATGWRRAYANEIARAEASWNA